MDHLNINNVRSPLTPIPPMSSSASSFDFSPSAISRLEVMNSTTTLLLASPCTPWMMAVTPTDEDDEQQKDVSEILFNLGMEQYEKLFEKEEIDMAALVLLTESDLEEIGITDQDHREILAMTIENLKLLKS